MGAFLSQSRFPMLWDIFQYVAGGTVDKRRLCSAHYKGQGRVLEVGCSVGNISEAFLRFPGMSYVGLDIDPAAIKRAGIKFKGNPSLTFVCDDLRDYATRSGCFGYILFAGCCHHMDDDLSRSLIKIAVKILEPGGIIVVVDPLLPTDADPWFVRSYMNLEQGQYVRTSRDMLNLLNGIDGLKVMSADEEFIGATPFGLPRCARFGTYVLRAA